MMDHGLRTISYIADIGDLVVIMARRRILPQDGEEAQVINSSLLIFGHCVVLCNIFPLFGFVMMCLQVIGTTPKMICHVFESEEVRTRLHFCSSHCNGLQAQFIAQSIGQAFQVAYMEFLKANGIEDHSFVKEMDYQEVLNSQEIYGDELAMFAKKELQKEVRHCYLLEPKQHRRIDDLTVL